MATDDGDDDGSVEPIAQHNDVTTMASFWFDWTHTVLSFSDNNFCLWEFGCSIALLGRTS
jgi:hypothetical protein